MKLYLMIVKDAISNILCSLTISWLYISLQLTFLSHHSENINLCMSYRENYEAGQRSKY